MMIPALVLSVPISLTLKSELGVRKKDHHQKLFSCVCCTKVSTDELLGDDRSRRFGSAPFRLVVTCSMGRLVKPKVVALVLVL